MSLFEFKSKNNVEQYIQKPIEWTFYTILLLNQYWTWNHSFLINELRLSLLVKTHVKCVVNSFDMRLNEFKTMFFFFRVVFKFNLVFCIMFLPKELRSAKNKQQSDLDVANRKKLFSFAFKSMFRKKTKLINIWIY